MTIMSLNPLPGDFNIVMVTVKVVRRMQFLLIFRDVVERLQLPIANSCVFKDYRPADDFYCYQRAYMTTSN